MGFPLQWRAEHIRAQKEKLNADLAKQGAAESRLGAVLEEIKRLESDDTSTGRLRRYICIVHALLIHERYGGLSPSDIKKLSALAEGILKVQGIKPESTRVLGIYWDLHIALSQLSRKAGLHWKSAWDLQLAMDATGFRRDQLSAATSLVYADRLMRLGGVAAALKSLEDNAGSFERPTERYRAELLRVIGYRLLGRWQESQALIANILKLKNVPDAYVLEFQWEKLVLDFLQNQDLRPILRAVKANGTHHYGTYIFDTILLGLASANRAWIDELPRATTVKRNKMFDPDRHQTIFECCATLQSCYESERPKTVRIKMLGESLELANQLSSIDREMLVWIGAARWLSRAKSPELAELCAQEYRRVSLAVSNGQNADTTTLFNKY